MIERRGFITGLISLVAAPAIARAGGITSVKNGTFDLAQRAFQMFETINFDCCIFKFNDQSDYIRFSRCRFDGCLLVGMGLVRPDSHFDVTRCLLRACTFVPNKFIEDGDNEIQSGEEACGPIS